MRYNNHMDKTVETYFGEYAKEGDVLYDPLTDMYKAKAGGRTIEIQGQASRYGNVKAFREAMAMRGETSGEAYDKVACMDFPELRPDRDPNKEIKVYYHDRFPSRPIRSIIEDAIGLLNDKKGLRISYYLGGIHDGEVSLALAANHPTDPWLRKVLEVTFPQKAFERFSHDVDISAGLTARLDTDTYIELRIAFLLYRALRLDDDNAKGIRLDVFRISASDTTYCFTF